ncbi:MAG: AsmA family protein [Rhodospirillales bacterium]
MRKAFLFSGLALTATIILVLASVTYVLFNIDALIKDEIEDAASRAYKVPVTVAEATMSLKSGNGRITDLRIENPPGFSAPTAIHVPVIEIAVDTGRIADKAIALGRVVIDRPEIVLDIKDGRANLVRLKESTDAWLTRSENDDEDAASGQRLIIDEIVMQNGTMIFRADFLDGAETKVPLPDSRVREIGVKPDGALPAEVIAEVTQLLITASERASRRIDLRALAEKTGATVPDIDLSALLKNE